MAMTGKLNLDAAPAQLITWPVTTRIAFAEIVPPLIWASPGRISIAATRSDSKGAARRKLATRQAVPKLVRIRSSRM
jgi:hypothetical protein